MDENEEVENEGAEQQDIYELFDSLIVISQSIMEELEEIDSSEDSKKDFKDIYHSIVNYISKNVE